MAVLIKRYANRKLYNTDTSRYITLKGISELVRENRDIRVIDNETGDDITPIILSQILVDDQKQARDQDPVAGRVLSELIQRGGDALYGLVRRSMGDMREGIDEARENLQKWVQNTPRPEIDTTEITKTVHSAVERVLRVMDLPTRADLEALNKNLERLSSALESFEARVGSRKGTS
jgi:polyhydroxyalkanoate synthesis repressor PhaR